MSDTIFTRIINGEIPSYKIYEDDKTFAFLDIHPVNPGHVLVIPKDPQAMLWDLDDANYQAVMITAKKVAQQIRNVLHPDYVGMQVVGTDVPHAHVHVIPFSASAELRRVPDANISPDNEALTVMAAKLAF